jgi:alpha-tubulin suppressor-like RCC1 family protein
VDWDCSPAPVQVAGLVDVEQVAAGGDFTCALKTDGTLWCWGGNAWYQLGDGQVQAACPELIAANGCTADPVQVAGLAGVLDLSAGRHGCAVLTDGTVHCWGPNTHRQLGHPSVPDAVCQATGSTGPLDYECSQSTVSATNLSDAASLGAGARHQCAVTSQGEARCWGRDTAGQLGDGPSADTCQSVAFGADACRPIPTPVSTGTGLGTVVQIAGGLDHTCALADDGTVWCWGDNQWGQLGHGVIGGAEDAPVQVADLTNIRAIALGDYHTCARHQDGTAWCWGRNDAGQLGNADAGQSSNVPVQVVPAIP